MDESPFSAAGSGPVFHQPRGGITFEAVQIGPASRRRILFSSQILGRVDE
ncbi:MAG: hypothetical protein ACREBG_30395 [Pyrinomonadaceae bacterium]